MAGYHTQDPQCHARPAYRQDRMDVVTSYSFRVAKPRGTCGTDTECLGMSRPCSENAVGGFPTKARQRRREWLHRFDTKISRYCDHTCLTRSHDAGLNDIQLASTCLSAGDEERT